ncbi:MAG TPA: DUF1697 domain-containing protein [Burkholderiaceae bacterium]|nr:DUF1697 domain-containing protein [Burkholderiaceae bacterium]
MTTYVAFLRAINVGGRFVKMAVLAQHFRDLGHADVLTYINSGNVVFGSTARKADALAAAIERGLNARLDFETHAFVRSAAQLHEIARRGMSLASDRTLADVNVAFLTTPLPAPQVAALLALRSAVDDFVVDGTEVYWTSRVGQRESTLSNAVFERKLKVRTTLRRAVMLHGLSQRLRG